jgi:hypothetical protein
MKIISMNPGWGAGFFSCCIVFITDIIKFLNEYGCFPAEAISKNGFHKYKRYPDDDVIQTFFEPPHPDARDYKKKPKKRSDIYERLKGKTAITHPQIEFGYWTQTSDYRLIEFDALKPVLKKYFTPTKTILDIKNALMAEYGIQPDNCVGLYYRGTDKKTEIVDCGFENYYNKVKEVLQPGQQLLVQTDSAPFLDYLRQKNLEFICIKQNEVSYTSNGIHNEKKPAENHEDMKYLLATVLILADCKSIVISTSNVSNWIVLARGHARGIHQWLGEILLWQKPNQAFNLWFA